MPETMTGTETWRLEEKSNQVPLTCAWFPGARYLVCLVSGVNIFPLPFSQPLGSTK